MKKTKIICTLGPASSKEETMEKMLLAGMNVARLNFSHGNHEDHEKTINKFRKVRDKMGCSAAVLLDTKGPEIRLGDFAKERVVLKDGQEFTLRVKDILGDENQAAMTYKNMYKQVDIGTSILIDDGRVSMKVVRIEGSDVVCKVKNGGKISNRKGVNVPKTHLDLPYLSEADKEDLKFGVKHDVDYVAASFVRSKEDVLDLRNFLDSQGGEKIKIISKIENLEGIDNFKSILQCSDGIMVARGDMGVEVNFAKLPGIQKKFIKECCQAGKLVITATQMLESMVNSLTPTRAEITDVANAVFDGTSAVMLSGESAMGKYPVETVKVMAKIVTQAEKDAFDVNVYKILDYEMDSKDKADAIGHAACTTAHDLKAKAIIAITQSGHTAEKMSKFRPKQPIVAATPKKKVYHQLALAWGVYPVTTEFEDEWDALFAQAVGGAKELNVVKKNDIIVISAGLPFKKVGNTNLIRVETV
ncbi:MAG: pyruvate kinase [Anaerovoracaceae bacterium]